MHAYSTQHFVRLTLIHDKKVSNRGTPRPSAPFSPILHKMLSSDPAISSKTRDLEISENFPYAIFQLHTNQRAEFTDPFTGLPGPRGYTLKTGAYRNLYPMVPQIN